MRSLAVTPFRLRVFTDMFEAAAQEDGVPGDPSSGPQLGFTLHFQQMSCA